MMLSVFWIVFWLLKSAICRGENSIHAFGTFSPLNDKVCRVDDRVFYNNAITTALMCVALCNEQPSCLSVFYKEESQSCIGCDDVYYENTLLTDEAGTEYYLDSQVTTGWSFFQGEYYRMFTDKVTPVVAQVICRRLLCRLAKVDSLAKHNFIKGLMSAENAVKVTIGLSDYHIEGTYRWMDDGAVAEYTNWYYSEPNGGRRENCGKIMRDNGYTWADAACNNTIYPSEYVCTKKAVQDI